MFPHLLLALLLQPPPADLIRQAEAKVQAEQFAEAEPLLQLALKHEPSNTDALFRLAYVEYRQRKLAPSRLHFTAVTKLAPPALNSRYFLGRIALLENKPKEAVAWLEPVARSGESIYDADSQLAAAYAATGDAAKAQTHLKAAIAQAPWDSALHYRLGQLYKKNGENELAKESLDTAARLQTASREDVEALMQVSTLLGEGKTAAALEAGAQVQGRPNPNPDSLVALGVLYGNARLPADALRAFERATTLDKQSFQAQFNHGLALLKSGQPLDALAPLTAALELLPQSPEAAMTLGLAAVMAQRYEGAIAPLEMARQRDAANPKLAALLGMAHLRANEPKKAIPLLRQATDPNAALLLVEALNATEATAEALDAARDAQKRFPKSPQAHMAAAQQLVRLGRYQEARIAFEQTLALAPGQPEAELGLADALQKTGQHQAAVAHYRAAPSSLPVTLGLARSLTALRQLEEARKVLEAELGRTTRDAALHQELARVYARLGLADQAAEQARLADQLRAR